MMLLTYNAQRKLQQSIRRLLVIFMAGLVVSGITAFPIESQLSLAHQWLIDFKLNGIFFSWIDHVYQGVKATNEKYPFISYGTDWLAFAHLVIAVIFIGPLKDPVRNIWIVEWGIIACVSIFQLASIAGVTRGIPFYWILIDCSFGVIGGILLAVCHRKIKTLAAFQIAIDK
jgi:hypothetical protein